MINQQRTKMIAVTLKRTTATNKMLYYSMIITTDLTKIPDKYIYDTQKCSNKQPAHT